MLQVFSFTPLLIVAAMLQVLQVAVVAVGLALKRDVPVGIASHDQSYHPLYQVQYIKQHITKLTHLSSVNALVVYST